VTEALVLLGRLVTFDPAWPEVEDGALYIGADEWLAAVRSRTDPAPGGFGSACRVETKGCIYPGLIDLHSHVVDAHVAAQRDQTDAWLAVNGDALAELVALEVELTDRENRDRTDRITTTLREQSSMILQRLGPRPDDPAAREAWDLAAAHLSDYQHAYGQPPEDERPRGGQRRRAWEEVQRSHADALDRFPDAPDDLACQPPRPTPAPTWVRSPA
jgi:cytosine/adenosine deaminase-related metal-dependent hydrolase